MTRPASKLLLHQFPRIPGAPSASPFCVKVHWALHLKELNYETRDTVFANRVSPSGKLPALDVDGELHVDSSAILRVLDAMVTTAPLYPPEPRARATTELIEDWADETLYWYVLWFRWLDDASFARLKRVFFADQPALLRAIAPTFARRKIAAQTVGQGIGRRSEATVLREFDGHLTMLDSLLEDRPFLVGDAITAADLAVGAQLMELRLGLTPREDATIAVHTTTSAWLARTMQRCA